MPMNKIIKLLLTVNLFFSAPIHAESSQLQLATGLSSAFYIRQDYGESTFSQFTPELVVYGYLPLSTNFWFRPGFRLNYSWLQPDMPQAFQIKETDLKYMLETGIVLDWIILPSLSYAFGFIYRNTTLATNYPITSVNDTVSGSEHLFYSHFQFGIGFPILKGFIVAEPFARYVMVQNDYRFKWAYGLEATFQIF